MTTAQFTAIDDELDELIVYSGGDFTTSSEITDEERLVARSLYGSAGRPFINTFDLDLLAAENGIIAHIEQGIHLGMDPSPALVLSAIIRVRRDLAHDEVIGDFMARSTRCMWREGVISKSTLPPELEEGVRRDDERYVRLAARYLIGYRQQATGMDIQFVLAARGDMLKAKPARKQIDECALELRRIGVAYGNKIAKGISPA